MSKQNGIFYQVKRRIGYARAWFMEYFHKLKLESSFLLFRLFLDRKKTSKELSVVILTCNPNPLFDACLDSVKKQTLKPCRIEVVSDISPVSRAEQVGLEKISTKYYVSVDADMILDRTFFEREYFLITRDSRNALCHLPVIDPILGRLYAGGRMYLTGPVKEIGYYPFSGARDHDRYMSQSLRKKGFHCILGDWICGQHHPVYLPHEAFWKFRTNAEKARYYGDHNPSLRELADNAMKYWRRTHDDVALYALAGLFEGMISDDIDKELTYDGRINDPAFLKISSFLEKKASAPADHNE